MWERLRRFSALPPSSKAVFLQATLLLPVTSLSLRLRGFRATQKWLEGHLPREVGDRTPVQHPHYDVSVVVRMVLAAAHHSPISTTCLERSLVLWWLLGRRNIASQLRIGVRKTGEKFEAHAWVECDGAAIAEPEASHLHYAPFAKEFSEELS